MFEILKAGRLYHRRVQFRCQSPPPEHRQVRSVLWPYWCHGYDGAGAEGGGEDDWLRSSCISWLRNAMPTGMASWASKSCRANCRWKRWRNTLKRHALAPQHAERPPGTARKSDESLFVRLMTPRGTRRAFKDLFNVYRHRSRHVRRKGHPAQ